MRGWTAVRVGLVAGAVLVGGLGLVACQNTNLMFTVTSSDDLPDNNPGDNSCQTTENQCTLRAAIDEANANSRIAQITVASSVDLTRPGIDDTNVNGDLDLDPGGGSVIIKADPGFQIETGTDDIEGIFDVLSGVAVFDDMTVNGFVEPSIHARAGARAVVIDSTIGSVTADPGATVSVNDTLLQASPALTNHGTATVGMSTVLGQIVSDGSTTVAGSILADSSGADCSAPVSSGGYDLATDQTCGLGAPTDLAPADPKLDPVTSAPSIDSPAFNSIPIGTPTLCDGSGVNALDVRQTPRPQNRGCDRGAIELSFDKVSFTVDSPADQHDVDPGDGRCATSAGTCTLRAAVDEDNALGSNHPTIVLGADPVLSIPGANEDDNASGDLDLHAASTTINGQGHVIDGNHLDRVLDVIGGSLSLSKVTITGGAPPVGGGGGILQRQPAVFDPNVTPNITVTDSTITGNETSVVDPSDVFASFGVGGAGLEAPDQAKIVRSTFQDNHANGAQGIGGAMIGGDITISDSALIDNSAAQEGGAIWDGATIDDSTIHGNTAPVGAAISTPFADIDQVTITDNVGASQLSFFQVGTPSIIERSALGGSSHLCAPGAQWQLSDDNTFTDTTCNAGGQAVTDLGLGSLALNGGTTVNQLPAASSPLVGFVDDCTFRPKDQRGQPRTAPCDGGSIEREPTDP
jgi:CSLREA domain-containing protein